MIQQLNESLQQSHLNRNQYLTHPHSLFMNPSKIDLFRIFSLMDSSKIHEKMQQSKQSNLSAQIEKWNKNVQKRRPKFQRMHERTYWVHVVDAFDEKLQQENNTVTLKPKQSSKEQQNRDKRSYSKIPQEQPRTSHISGNSSSLMRSQVRQRNSQKDRHRHSSQSHNGSSSYSKNRSRQHHYDRHRDSRPGYSHARYEITYKNNREKDYRNNEHPSYSRSRNSPSRNGSKQRSYSKRGVDRRDDYY